MPIKGLAELEAKLNAAFDRYRGAMAAAVYQEACVIGRESILQVPVDTGRLRASFYVAPPAALVNPVVRMGYGVDYALPVHEMTDVPHKVGKAKFLEDPINDAKGEWLDRVAKRTKTNFDSNIGLSDANGLFPESPQVTGGGPAKVGGKT